MASVMSDLSHVTQELRDAGLVDVRYFTEFMRERGTALHLACELHDKGDLDLGSIDPEIKGSFQGYLKFCMEVQPEILAIEEKVEMPGMWCGRLDRRVKINGREGILDIKGQPSKVDPLQLAGYAKTFDRPMRRWNLYLRVKLGDYKLVEHKDTRRDDLDWLAAVRIAAWRRRNKCLPQT